MTYASSWKGIEMYYYYLSLGSNIENEYKHISTALNYLRNLKQTKLRLSQFYTTAPQNYEKQRDFLNVCCLLDCDLNPLQMLRECKAIERKVGRVPGIRYGPRVIDIDIIWVRGFKLISELLTIPHAKAADRAFVLKPLSEIVESDRELSAFIEENLPKVENQRVELVSEFMLKKMM